MERGWNAKGLLTPLYEVHGGRDGLAIKVGAPPGTLSAVNSGKRNLGIRLARRIAQATKISVLELGAPEENADAKGLLLIERLEGLEAEAVTIEEVYRVTTPLREAILLLASGNTDEALRVLSGPADRRA